MHLNNLKPSLQNQIYLMGTCCCSPKTGSPKCQQKKRTHSVVGGVGVLLGVSTCRFQVLSQLIKQPLTRWSLHIRSALHALCRSKVSIFLGLNIERQTAGQSPTNHSALSFMTCVMSSGRQGLSKQTNINSCMKGRLWLTWLLPPTGRFEYEWSAGVYFFRQC